MSIIVAGGKIIASAGGLYSTGGGSGNQPQNVTFINQGGATNADDSSPASSSSSTLGIQWDPVAGATGYNIYRSVDGGAFTLYASNVQPTSWTASFSGNVMTVAGSVSGQSIYPGVRFSAAGLLAETQVYDAWGAQSTSGTGGSGTYPINRSQTLASTTCTACYYIDTGATNAVQADKSRPGTIYDYNVTAIVSGVEGAQSNNIVQWGYRNGFTNWGKGTNGGDEVSFGPPFPNSIYNSTNGNPQGGPFVLEYQVNGGFQPACSRPQNPQWQMEVGWAKYLIFDFNPGSAYTGWALNVGVVSGVPEGDVFGLFPQVNAFSGSYGPVPAANTWGTYKIPLATLGINKNTFAGSISGSTITVTAASLGAGLFGSTGMFDNSGYLVGTNIPVPAWVHGNLTGGSGPGGSGAGSTWTGWGAPYTPGVHSGTALNVSATSDSTWTFHKHQLYKFVIYAPSGPTQQSYINNLGFSRA